MSSTVVEAAKDIARMGADLRAKRITADEYRAQVRAMQAAGVYEAAKVMAFSAMSRAEAR